MLRVKPDEAADLAGRMLTLPVEPGGTGGFSGRRFAGFSLLPWSRVAALESRKHELVGPVWRAAEAVMC